MILASHNSFTYLKPRKWWMRLLSFMAKCQDVDMLSQYNDYDVRCFDLRIRFDEKSGDVKIAHGIIEYSVSDFTIHNMLRILNGKKDVFVRVLLETRTKKQYTTNQIMLFRNFCDNIVKQYRNITFFGGRNLYNWVEDYKFEHNFSIDNMYASVQKPMLIDDWYPRLYAKLNNKKIFLNEFTNDILMIDFVNYR